MTEPYGFSPTGDCNVDAAATTGGGSDGSAEITVDSGAGVVGAGADVACGVDSAVITEPYGLSSAP
jgi:hypothetical protein